MKTYEKPKLMVLSISANDALCGNCTAKTRGHNDITVLLNGLGIYDTDGNGAINRNETGSYFANNETDCHDSVGFDLYCKFTTESGAMLFTS